jgi:OOP family OmpA-OmpF porin
MKKILLSTVTISTLLFAQNQPYELTLTAGGTYGESNLHLEDNHKNFGFRFGMPNNYILNNMFDTIELAYEKSNDVEYDDTTLETDIDRYAVNLLHHYKYSDNYTPYGLFGVGYEDFQNEYKNTNDSVTTNIGLGLKYHLTEDINLRFELRDQINLESGIENELIYTVGLGFSFGGVVTLKDEDKDGVIDSKDKCLGTPLGKSVDTDGCLLVKDDDNDGVTNEKDSCPNSPIDAIVNEKGCQLDSDNDGVVNEKDSCPTTPTGAPVDEKGCALDSDEDGIIDMIDKCPNTQKGYTVDNSGCASNFNFQAKFDTDKDIVKDQYIPTLESFVKFMNANPSFNAEIQGYTDSIGSETYNKNLSQKRAKSVMNKLIELGVEANRLTYKGYGIENPIASNDTQEGREENRRVEAKIIK